MIWLSPLTLALSPARRQAGARGEGIYVRTCIEV